MKCYPGKCDGNAVEHFRDSGWGGGGSKCTVVCKSDVTLMSIKAGGF